LGNGTRVGRSHTLVTYEEMALLISNLAAGSKRPGLEDEIQLARKHTKSWE